MPEDKKGLSNEPVVDAETVHQNQVKAYKRRIRAADPYMSSDLFAVSFYRERYVVEPEFASGSLTEYLDEESSVRGESLEQSLLAARTEVFEVFTLTDKAV